MPATSQAAIRPNTARRLADADSVDIGATALITAAARALESKRAFGWLRDPFAERLAGSRGLALARSLTALDRLSFMIGMRTRIIDDLLLDAIRQHKIATVINLGAGLDTRPWRLPLPADLCWLEADLAPVLDNKHSLMRREPPNCKLVSMALDVNSSRARQKLFRKKFLGPTLLLTEGLLMYLPAGTVRALIAQAQNSIDYWLLELTASNPLPQIAALRAPDALSGPRIARLLRDAGFVRTGTRDFTEHALHSAPFGRLHELLQTVHPAAFHLASSLAGENGAYLLRSGE